MKKKNSGDTNMKSTQILQDKIMATPWLLQLTKQANTQEELRALIMQMMKDAPSVLEGIDEVLMSYVRWDLLLMHLKDRPDQLYKIAEIAKLLNLNQQTIYAYVRKGFFEVTRIGRQYRISQAALDKYLATWNKKDDGKE